MSFKKKKHRTGNKTPDTEPKAWGQNHAVWVAERPQPFLDIYIAFRDDGVWYTLSNIVQ